MSSINEKHVRNIFMLLAFIFTTSTKAQRVEVCGPKATFSTCGTACPKRCGEPLASICTLNCVRGCFCDEGYCLDKNDNCVPFQETPPALPVLSAFCGRNAVYSTCGSACPLKCNKPPKKLCLDTCEVGCFCKEGFCQNVKGNCVPDCRGDGRKLSDKVTKNLRTESVDP